MLLLDDIDNAVIDDVKCMIMNKDSAFDALLEVMEAVDDKCFYYQCYI